MYGSMKLVPDLIIKSLMVINRNPAFLALCGRTDYIESITFHEAALFALTILNPILLFRISCSYAHSFNRDKESGMLMYFNSQNISRASYWLTQLILNAGSYTLNMIILGVCFTLMSLSGVPVKILREITLDNVYDCLIALVSVGFFCFSAGLVYGMLHDYFHFKSNMHTCFIVMIIIYIFPNIIDALTALIDNSGSNTFLQQFHTITCYIRKCNPLYWCNPWNPADKPLCIAIVMIGFANILVSFVVYMRKNLAV
jgi:hypothetical protein